MTCDILQGDVRQTLRTLPEKSIHCCVTSPPYWGLRDYGCAGQLGLEQTPEQYIAEMVAVFAEVRRVLRDDGTLFLNIGDSYCAPNGRSSGGTYARGPNSQLAHMHEAQEHGIVRGFGDTLKPKDLCMIPWRLALALQADGWWLRSVIVWHKRSPMPESVTDRPTSSWEPIFLLAKSERYFYDHVAVRQKATAEPHNSGYVNGAEYAVGPMNRGGHSQREDPERVWAASGGANLRNVWTLSAEPCKEAHFATFPSEIPHRAIAAGTSERGCCPTCGAPWERITTEQVVHQRPPEAVRQAEAARAKSIVPGNMNNTGEGSLRDGFRETVAITTGWQPTCNCGAPDDLQSGDLELIETPTGERVGDDPSIETGRAGMNRPRGENEGSRPITRYEQRMYAAQLKKSSNRKAMADEAGTAFPHYCRTDRNGARPIPDTLLQAWLDRGWLTRVMVPTWTPPQPVPCTVLDPFGGSGTTGLEAVRMGRRAILCELNPAYVEIIRKRLAKVNPLFALPIAS